MPHVDALSLTRELLSFDTTNPPGQERDCAKFIGEMLEEGGFHVSAYEFAERRTSFISWTDGSKNKPPICFTGHIDAVPLGANRWSKDPFSGELDGDRVCGRGSTDMKAGVATMIVAALRLVKSSTKTAGIKCVITAGEETGCQGAYHLARLGGVLGQAGAILVGEPTSNYPLIGHKGALWLEAQTAGVTAHGSMPEQGVNAIYRAAQAVKALQEYIFQSPPHPLLGAPTLNVGRISGG